MSYFPISLSLSEKKLLLVGGGKVAAEKLTRILRFTDQQITVVAEYADEVRLVLEEHSGTSVKLLERRFWESDLDDADLVFLATGDHALHQEIASLCRERRILVNAADDPKLCDFLLPAVEKRGSLTVAVGTEGKSPAFAATLKERISESLPRDAENLLDCLGTLRESIRKSVPERERRKGFFEELVRLMLEKNRVPTEEELSILRKKWENPE